MTGPNGAGAPPIDEERVRRLTMEITGRINLNGAPVVEVLLVLASVVRAVVWTAGRGSTMQRLLFLGGFIGDLYADTPAIRLRDPRADLSE